MFFSPTSFPLSTPWHKLDDGAVMVNSTLLMHVILNYDLLCEAWLRTTPPTWSSEAIDY